MNVSKLTQWRMGDSNARTALDDLYEEALATAHRAQPVQHANNALA